MNSKRVKFGKIGETAAAHSRSKLRGIHLKIKMSKM
jgi:hypothetical protein